MNSYIINNSRIGSEKYTYDVLIESIVKPLNDEMKVIMNENMCVF